MIIRGLVILMAMFLPHISFALPSNNEIIAEINNKREKIGIPTLISSNKLDEAALVKAKEIAAKGSLVHSVSTKNIPWKTIVDEGYIYKTAGENLAVGFTSGHDVVGNWMNSPTHKANILNKSYSEIGTASFEGEYNGEMKSYTVTYFATPKDNIQKKEIVSTVPAVSSSKTQTSVQKQKQINKSQDEKVLFDLLDILQQLMKELALVKSNVL